MNRRSLLQKGVAGVVGWTITGLPSFAAQDSALEVPKGKSVLVLGASGKTGLECVSASLAMGRPCIATTRSGDFDYPTTSNLSVASADVSSLESVENAIGGFKDLGAVIFAASVGSKGGDAFAVDRDGVINAAKACIAAGIPRLVIVSSGTVTRPDSAVYKLLNTVGKGIMEAKIQGEDTLREMYAAPDVVEKKLGYTVIRPGGLTVEPSVGAGELELNQGDTKSGRLPRADVAALCINCLDSSDAFDTTFECYETLTAKPIESVGFSNLLKSKDPTTFITGKERHGDTWNTLFQGLSRDEGHLV